MTAIVAGLTASNPDKGLAMAFTVVMLAGLFQIVFGIFRLGKYITLMPYGVISGFMSGIGVIFANCAFFGASCTQGWCVRHSAGDSAVSCECQPTGSNSGCGDAGDYFPDAQKAEAFGAAAVGGADYWDGHLCHGV